MVFTATYTVIKENNNMIKKSKRKYKILQVEKNVVMLIQNKIFKMYPIIYWKKIYY